MILSIVKPKQIGRLFRPLAVVVRNLSRVSVLVRNVSRFQLAEFAETFVHEVPERPETVHGTTDEVAFVQTPFGVYFAVQRQTRVLESRVADVALCFLPFGAWSAKAPTQAAPTSRLSCSP
jgi:hypothetical protein